VPAAARPRAQPAVVYRSPGGKPIWRRVLLPATATLGDLHEVIQVLFGWDGDHLHVFESGKKSYGDPFVNLEGTGNEEAVRVRDAMTAGGTIAYTYDLGASSPAGRCHRSRRATTTRSGDAPVRGHPWLDAGHQADDHRLQGGRQAAQANSAVTSR
jgi:Plasmid pRiA4b ORF-3-like protein